MMNNTDIHAVVPGDDFIRWETAYGPGIKAVAREPWLKGRVHVVEQSPPLRDWTQTNLGPLHFLMLFTRPQYGEEKIINGAHLWSKHLNPGDLSIYTPTLCTTPHASRSRSEELSFISVGLEPAFVAGISQASGRDYASMEFLNGFGVRDPLLEQLIYALGAEIETGCVGGRLYAEQLMQTVVVQFLRQYCTVQHRVKTYQGGLPNRVLKRVIERLRAQMDCDFSLETLAAEAKLSTYHFARQFKVSTGEAPYQYLMRLRIKEAQRLLQQTNLPLAEIALAVGYSGQARFTTAFKQLTGTTPGRFRRES